MVKNKQTEKNEVRCISCGITLTGSAYTSFICPKCNDFEIARCKRCRKQSNKYACPKCNFLGP